MRDKPISKEKLVELFRSGATRKLEERELFVMRSLENPEREPIYNQLRTYVDMEWRFYDLAAHYYSEDLEYFENGLNEDLLTLADKSELSPKLYAEYLREVNPDERLNEKITHAYLTNLKKNIKHVREELR